MGLIEWSREQSSSILQSELPGRWRHVTAVASRAAAVFAEVANDDREVVIAAAWLHDIGYAPRLIVSGSIRSMVRDFCDRSARAIDCVVWSRTTRARC